MSILDGLNPNQKQAVLSDEKYIRVIAGAGSGKTRVLTSRITHLIQDEQVMAYRILAITFTNKAANEMKERIMKMLDDPNTQVWISTIHSLCVRILREDIASLGFPKNFTIIDTEDQKSILKEAYAALNIDKSKVSFASALNYISNNKTARIMPDKAMDFASDMLGEKEKAYVYEYYVQRLKQMYALDFDDLLLYTVQLFETYEVIQEKWARRFHYIHVDEFQDIDEIQYQLIRYLAGNQNSLYVVGDPDQTIYTWRGADVNIIMNFEKDFKPSKTIILNENYRSTNAILNGANSLIKNNRNRYEKDLFTQKQGGHKIIHHSLANEEYEGYWIATEIKRLQREGVALRDIGILYRSNYLSRSLEKAMVEHQIPYVIFGGIRFYERAEVKDSLSYLRMILLNDDLAFKRVVNTPKRGIGNKTIDTIFEKANQERCTMYEVVKDFDLFTGKTKVVLDQFVRMIESWKTRAKDMDIETTLQMCLEESGYTRYLEGGQETDRLENIKELLGDIESFQENYPEATLDEYLQLVSLYGDKSQYESGIFVQMMSIHAAKGLEFDYVFVVGMSDGVFPSERSMSDGIKGIEEERRLAYVAMTRARKQLFLSDAAGFSYVLNKPRVTSRFVDEIDEEHIEHLNQATRNNPTRSIYSSQKKEVQSTTKSAIMSASTTSSSSKSKRFRKGDKVKHNMYNEGVIISINDDMMQIAFSYPHGLKKISTKFKGLEKL
ncbi:MAG: UvrD-helicase domain-containing protein [Erysipelotrichaceae bacterium]